MTSNFTKQPGQTPTFVSLNLFIRQGYLSRVACQYRWSTGSLVRDLEQSSAIDLSYRRKRTNPACPESSHSKMQILAALSSPCRGQAIVQLRGNTARRARKPGESLIVPRRRDVTDKEHWPGGPKMEDRVNARCLSRTQNTRL